MTVKTGHLRHRIALQTYAEAPTGSYDTSKTWTTIASFWGIVEPVKGLVYFDTKQIGEGVTHKITVRYNPAYPISTEHWLLYDGRRYRVRSVVNTLERDRFLELLCEVEQDA